VRLRQIVERAAFVVLAPASVREIGLPLVHLLDSGRQLARQFNLRPALPGRLPVSPSGTLSLGAEHQKQVVARLPLATNRAPLDECLFGKRDRVVNVRIDKIPIKIVVGPVAISLKLTRMPLSHR